MSNHDFKRLNRMMLIYRVIQSALIALLIVMAFYFQSLFTHHNKPGQFVTSFIAAIIGQIILIYPIYKLAWRDAGVEVDGSVTGLSAEQLNGLRKKRLIGDMWKFSLFSFYLAFIFMTPDAKKATGAPLVLASTLFSFLLTCLTYFQCFNYCAKKRMKPV